jgi:hypothetical protein
MKKFESLGKIVSKAEQKKILGGRILMSQSGYTGDSTNCYCDYHYQYPDGSTLDYCYIPCAGTCCSPGYGCSLAIA